jgi:hypothetical protein
MNNNKPDTTITIPAAIATLPLVINEKIALVRINEDPRCRNADLAKSIGITERGAKKLLQRLRSAGHVEQTRKGRARRLYLTFHVEQGTEFPNPETQTKLSNGELCSEVTAPALPKQLGLVTVQPTLESQFCQTMQVIHDITRQPHVHPLTVVRLLQPLIRRVEAEMVDGQDKNWILQELAMRQGAFIAISMGAGLPKDIQRRLDETITRATPQQLIEFGQRAMAGNILDRASLLLSDWVPA